MGQVVGKEEEGAKVVHTGIDQLLASNFGPLRNGKVGVITNATGVYQNMIHLVDVMHRAEGVDMVAIFGPEHGFRSSSQAGSSEGFYIDSRTSVPVYDTYQRTGKTLVKLFEDAGVDTLLFDIQDVGVRFYTYIWTLYDCMVAAAMSAKPIKMVVADRPNPLGGAVLDGPIMMPTFSSFVGRKAIALRHGMTVAELAKLFNAEFIPSDTGKQVDLEVIKMEGWNRRMLFRDTRLMWIPPSPNVPLPTTALLYAGMGLVEIHGPPTTFKSSLFYQSNQGQGSVIFHFYLQLEFPAFESLKKFIRNKVNMQMRTKGTNCSEGRGTALPFQLIGASYVHENLVVYLQQQYCPGILFREACFKPFSSKFSGITVYGIQIHMKDPNIVNPIRTALTIIVALCKLYPNKFEWRRDGKSFWIDKLVGNHIVRDMISHGATVDEVMASWQDDVTWFGAMRAKYLLY